MGQNLLHDVRMWADKDPDREAIVFGDERVSYGELIDRLEARLAAVATLAPRDGTIGVVADNCVEFVELLMAVPAAGRTLAIVNSRAELDDVGYVLDRVEPGAVFLDAARRERFGEIAERHRVVALEGGATTPVAGVSEPVAVDADDPAWLIHTSGTTARPKGVVLPIRSIQAAASSFVDHLGVTSGSRILMPFSLSHVTAHAVPAALAVGAALIVQSRFDPGDYLASIERERATIAPVAPAMLHMILDHPSVATTDVTSLVTLFYGSSAIAESLLRRALAVFPDVDFVQAYGQTESCGAALWLGAEDHRRGLAGETYRLRAAGRPGSDVQVRVVDPSGEDVEPGREGELLLRGDQVMTGYFDDPQATTAALSDEWLHTGDVVVQANDGLVTVVDRLKDMIISGGENVSSLDVEGILAGHPGVREVAVVGVPDDRWGEAVTAVVVPDDASAFDVEEFLAFSRERLAGFKRPRHLVIVDKLPRNVAGKVLKADLRATLIRGHGGPRADGDVD